VAQEGRRTAGRAAAPPPGRPRLACCGESPARARLGGRRRAFVPALMRPPSPPPPPGARPAQIKGKKESVRDIASIALKTVISEVSGRSGDPVAH
jgi:hypothetical protein